VVGAWDGEMAGVLLEILRSRSNLFPDWALGEKQGWDGRREELGPLPVEHGYMWTDSLYDYHKTLAAGDWAKPVARS
jgi:hypothetical protein